MNFSPSAADARELWRAALSRPHYYPREEAFRTLVRDVTGSIQEFCNTHSHVLLMTSAGTAAVEAAIASLPRDTKAVIIRNGYFGERLQQIASFHYEKIYSYELPFGQPFSHRDKSSLIELIKGKEADAVLCVHLETSSGVLNDISAVCRAAKKTGVLTLIDGISSSGSVECDLGELSVNCFISSAYKSLLCPVGLSFIIADDVFLQRANRLWSYSYNLPRLNEAADQHRFLWSPNVMILHCLQGVLDGIRMEGKAKYFGRLEEKAAAFRKLISQGGLTIFGESESLSPCFTTLKLKSKNADEWLKKLKEDFGIVIGKGLGDFADDYLRIGHYPHRTADELEVLAKALVETERALEG